MDENTTKVARYALDVIGKVAVGTAIYAASMSISQRVKTYRANKAELANVNDTAE
jgi:hypothetical protein